MTITEALKKDNSIRIVNGDKWMTFTSFNNMFTVFQRKRKKHHTEELAQTPSEEEAVYILLKS